MKIVEKHYNKLAEVYDIKWKGYNNKTAEEIIKNLKLTNNLKVLDTGCGTGVLIQKLLGKNSKLNITGIDISDGMLKIAEERLNNLVSSANDTIFERKFKSNISFIYSEKRIGPNTDP